jgi:uncharacterized membrane protein
METHENRTSPPLASRRQKGENTTRSILKRVKILILLIFISIVISIIIAIFIFILFLIFFFNGILAL